jgi:hypothetical protein
MIIFDFGPYCKPGLTDGSESKIVILPEELNRILKTVFMRKGIKQISSFNFKNDLVFIRGT